MPIKTGLSKLDSLLKNGIPDESSILVLGPPKSGKTLFGLHFLFEGLQNDEYGIYVVTNTFPEDIVKRFELIGDVDEALESGMLKFVDCYTVYTGVQKKNTVFIVRVSGPTALTEMGIAFSQIIKQIPKNRKVRVIFDSVSTLLLYNTPRIVENFVQSMNGRIKGFGATSMFIMEEGMHDQKDVITINSILDALIHLKGDTEEREIEINGFGIDQTVKYSIVNGKIICR